MVLVYVFTASSFFLENRLFTMINCINSTLNIKSSRSVPDAVEQELFEIVVI